MPADWRETARRLGVRPLSARSLVLSTLLGSHPPRLPGPALIAVGALFDLGPGTMRTAVSRMVADGELIAVGGGQFELGAAMLDRQQRLDVGREGRHEPWMGEWWTAIVLADRRGLAERRLFRAEMTKRLMGELRPDVWLRPANVRASGRQRRRPRGEGSSSTVIPVEIVAHAVGSRRAGDDGAHAPVEVDAVDGGPGRRGSNRACPGRSSCPWPSPASWPSSRSSRARSSAGEWPVDELRESYRDLERRHGRSLRGYIGDAVDRVTDLRNRALQLLDRCRSCSDTMSR